MGTRNLTIAIKNKRPFIAQYGQWDGYLNGAGRTVAEFCSNPENIAALCAKADDCLFLDETALNRIWRKYSKTDWMNAAQAEKYKRDYPSLSRDVGADILAMVAAWPGLGIPLRNSYEFAADSLFCEYAYCVDLDKGRLEIYKGFNKRPVAKTSRFAPMNESREGGDYPVRLIGKFYFTECLAGLENLIAKGF